MTYEWETQGYYGNEWEVVTTDTDKASALDSVRTYRENEIGVPFRVKRVKVKG